MPVVGDCKHSRRVISSGPAVRRPLVGSAVPAFLVFDESVDHHLSEGGVAMSAERYMALSEVIYVPTDITCVVTAVVEGRLDDADERAFRQAYDSPGRACRCCVAGSTPTIGATASC
jgi:hypothetical protein